MPEPFHSCAGDDRRGFLKRVFASFFGAGLGLAPMAAGLPVLFDPLRLKSSFGAAVRVTTLEALPADGLPRKFPVLTDHVDAWNKFYHVPVGAVYLRHTPEGGLEALNVVCPHAGGFVDYIPGQNCFVCPLHDSRFALDGRIADPSSPAARGMDSLEVEVRNEREVWVKFQNFEAGKAAKIPVG